MVTYFLSSSQYYYSKVGLGRNTLLVPEGGQQEDSIVVALAYLT